MKLFISLVVLTLLVVYTGADEAGQQKSEFPTYKSQQDDNQLNFENMVSDWMETIKETAEKIESSSAVQHVKKTYEQMETFLEGIYDWSVENISKQWKNLFV
ncbi:uncharacterized protein O3C94_015105 [Discoglossus pictus]